MSRPAELLFANPMNKRPTGVSPNGQFLLFSTTPSEQGDLWLLPLAGGADRQPQPFLQTPEGEGAGQFSPDGHWVAYQRFDAGASEIYVTTFPVADGKRQISNGGGLQPRWRAHGKELFFVSPDGRLNATEITLGHDTIDVGRTQSLFGGIYTNRGYMWDVSADGQRFLVAQGDEEKLRPMTLVQNWTRLTKP